MSEYFTPLRPTQSEIAPDPAEIRARGELIRSRRRQRQGMALLASALVVIGGATWALARPTDPGSEPPVVGQPSPNQPSSLTPAPEGVLPKNLPLDSGWDADLADSTIITQASKVQRVQPCSPPASLPRPVQRQAAAWEGISVNRHREAVAYDDEKAAKEVFAWLLEARRNCRPPAAPGGTWTQTMRPLDIGNEAFVLSGMYDPPTALGLDNLVVARFGHVIVSSRDDGEFAGVDATPRYTADVAELRPVFRALCGAGAAPCSTLGSSLSQSAAPAPRILDSHLLDAAGIAARMDLSDKTEVTLVDDSSFPTMSCQRAYLRTLEPAQLRYREFDLVNPDSKPPLGHVATAVLGYADRESAAKAYDTLKGWLTDCSDTLRSAHPIRTRNAIVVVGDQPERWVRRNTIAAAPEVCTECDSGWVEQQGISLVGDRVVVLAVGSVVDLQLDPPDYFSALMRQARRQATD